MSLFRLGRKSEPKPLEIQRVVAYGDSHANYIYGNLETVLKDSYEYIDLAIGGVGLRNKNDKGQTLMGVGTIQPG